MQASVSVFIASVIDDPQSVVRVLAC